MEAVKEAEAKANERLERIIPCGRTFVRPPIAWGVYTLRSAFSGGLTKQ